MKTAIWIVAALTLAVPFADCVEAEQERRQRQTEPT